MGAAAREGEFTETELEKIDLSEYPETLAPLISGGEVYDFSSSPEARVIFLRRHGLYVKSAEKGALCREAEMTRYFYSKGLSAKVEEYISAEKDFLITARLPGSPCTAEIFTGNPERLADTLGERLRELHETGHTDCPAKDRTREYIEGARRNYFSGRFDKTLFPDNWSYESADKAYSVLEKISPYLKSDTLIHGDYCLPNILLSKSWNLAGFIDLGGAGAGDRHIDLFWGVWTLFYNLGTDAYRNRFLDAYGRSGFSEELLRAIVAAEVFA